MQNGGLRKVKPFSNFRRRGYKVLMAASRSDPDHALCGNLVFIAPLALVCSFRCPRCSLAGELPKI